MDSHIAKEQLYKTSGHWDKFGDELFKVKGKTDNFILKPMNCPHHMQILILFHLVIEIYRYVILNRLRFTEMRSPGNC